MDVTFADASGTAQQVPATPDHPWLVERDGARSWVETENLKPGDRLVTEDADRLTLTAVTLRAGLAQTYNLEVADLHTFLIREDGVVVHNGPCPLRGKIPDFRRALGESGKAPKWMNQWPRQGRSPPGHEVDHVVPRSVGGTSEPGKLRLRTKADHINRHRFYRPWEK